MSGSVVKLDTGQSPLLRPEDPPPFEMVNPGGGARVLLSCDHASRAVPAALAGLGLDDALLRRHIGWDIGAADVTRRLAGLLDARALLAGYSRLVIDCNRPPGAPGSIPAVSDGIAVPGTEALDGPGAQARVDACFQPYHAAFADAVDGLVALHGGPPALISVHSFTPVMEGFERRWHIGVLWKSDRRFARALIEALERDATLRVGDNEPYSGLAPLPYSIPTHAEARGLPHVTVEIRQDLIDTHHGAEAWANILAAALAGPLNDPKPYREG